MPFLTFDCVSYFAGQHQVLDRVSFSVERGDRFVLLGSSGSGKTTALRLINRMLEPSGGDIHIDGRNIAALDPIALRRRIGYVIQELGLLPHWTVEQNVSLVPQLLGWPEARRRERANQLLEQVGLGGQDLADRKPSQLSGGQRQRVAVARALAAGPDLLLFDEPFGALDPVTRREMQKQLLSLSQVSNIPVIFVTHDVTEALTLATRIAVLGNGKLECIVSPQEFVKAKTPVARSFLDTLPEASLTRGAAI